MESLWVDNEAAHKARMFRSRLELTVLATLAALTPLAMVAYVVWKHFHPGACG